MPSPEAESGAEKALKALAVAAKEQQAHATDAQKKLRVRLRAHGQALGDLLRPDGLIRQNGIDAVPDTNLAPVCVRCNGCRLRAAQVRS